MSITPNMKHYLLYILGWFVVTGLIVVSISCSVVMHG